MNVCNQCGITHDNPDDHDYIYTQSQKELTENGLNDPITLRPFLDPIDLSCGHTFTKHSIIESLHINKVCPLCKKRPMGKLKESTLLFRNLLNALEVSCPNKCNFKTQRELLKNHLSDCPNIKKPCLNKINEEKCPFSGTKNDMDIHNNECGLRALKCNGEGKCKIYARYLPTHSCIQYLLTMVSKNNTKLDIISNKYMQMDTHITTLLEANKQKDDILLAMATQHQTFMNKQINCNKEQKDEIILLNKKYDDCELSITKSKETIVNTQHTIETDIQKKIHILMKEHYNNYLSLLSKKSKGGDLASQLEFAKLYEDPPDNKYILKNIQLAHYWYTQASLQDPVYGKKRLELFEKNHNIKEKVSINTLKSTFLPNYSFGENKFKSTPQFGSDKYVNVNSGFGVITPLSLSLSLSKNKTTETTEIINKSLKLETVDESKQDNGNEHTNTITEITNDRKRKAEDNDS